MLEKEIKKYKGYAYDQYLVFIDDINFFEEKRDLIKKHKINFLDKGNQSGILYFYENLNSRIKNFDQNRADVFLRKGDVLYEMNKIDYIGNYTTSKMIQLLLFEKYQKNDLMRWAVSFGRSSVLEKDLSTSDLITIKNISLETLEDNLKRLFENSPEVKNIQSCIRVDLRESFIQELKKYGFNTKKSFPGLKSDVIRNKFQRIEDIQLNEKDSENYFRHYHRKRK